MAAFSGLAEGAMALTDEPWAVLERLAEACRPQAKVAPQQLRRSVGAIL